MTISVNIKAPKITVDAYRASVGGVPYDEYIGSYTITPKTNNQTMETENKVMTNDVSILAIPYYETSNQSGTTVIIGA